VLDKLLQGAKASMLWTDPPYNVNYKSHGGGLAAEGKSSIKNDHMAPEEFKAFIDGTFANLPENLETGGAVYVCSGWQSYPVFMEAMLKYGFYLSSVITWVKPGGSLGWGDYKHQTEIIAKAKKPDHKTGEAIIYGWKNGKHTFYGDNELDVWEMPRKSVQHYLHPTEKPDWLPMRAIRNSTKRGEIVLDLFTGSGSVMSAAEKTGRVAYMVELDPKFCDAIRGRWERIEKAKEKNSN
jgi:DNA modification methylase